MSAIIPQVPEGGEGDGRRPALRALLAAATPSVWHELTGLLLLTLVYGITRGVPPTELVTLVGWVAGARILWGVLKRFDLVL